MSRPTYVYLMGQIEIIGRWKKKIGIGFDPEDRVRELQTGNPDEIILIYMTPIGRRARAKRVENAVHDTLDKLHIRGEWFYWPPLLDIFLVLLIKVAKWTNL